MKANKLIAFGLPAVLAAVGVTVATFEGEELVGYVDPIGIETACFGHTVTAIAGKCQQQPKSDPLHHLNNDPLFIKVFH